MSAARDQLIADWHSRLAAAEALAIESPQFAWLARVRIRLYKFLLACYGAGDWNTSEPDLPQELPAPPAEHEPSSAIFDSADGQPLHGKPAKSIGKIQAVLKSVANAQDQPLAPGPLTGGLDPTCWVVVAAAGSNLRIGHCLEVIRRSGVHARIANRGSEWVVEVAAADRHQAMEILEENRQEVRRTRALPPQVRGHGPEKVPMGVGMFVILIVFASLFFAVLMLNLLDAFELLLPDHVRAPTLAARFQYAYALLVFLAFTTVLFLIAAVVGRIIPVGRQARKKIAAPSNKTNATEL